MMAIQENSDAITANDFDIGVLNDNVDLFIAADEALQTKTTANMMSIQSNSVLIGLISEIDVAQSGRLDAHDSSLGTLDTRVDTLVSRADAAETKATSNMMSIQETNGVLFGGADVNTILGGLTGLGFDTSFGGPNPNIIGALTIKSLEIENKAFDNMMDVQDTNEALFGNISPEELALEAGSGGIDTSNGLVGGLVGKSVDNMIEIHILSEQLYGVGSDVVTALGGLQAAGFDVSGGSIIDALFLKILDNMDGAMTAQSTADSAQSSANGAQSSADGAQTTANDALSLAGGLLPGDCTAGQVLVYDSASGSWECGNQVPAMLIGGQYYPLVQFNLGEHVTCPPTHGHTVLASNMAVEAYDQSKIPEPADDCGFGLVGEEIFVVTIHMSQSQIDAWNSDTGLMIPQ